ncbi:hypothetical protein BT63DRAFT_132816 [Microthyrium microscopicum]|uniref:Uncharacterized protein n=1 Tax=Microthyrium microscopicum TaxID=703497 RepID=A0A6A6UNJ3_9PEZI|nr:hypothetical protein BT63DRAFT_132816 [Microthyrium microscopicum]
MSPRRSRRISESRERAEQQAQNDPDAMDISFDSQFVDPLAEFGDDFWDNMMIDPELTAMVEGFGSNQNQNGQFQEYQIQQQGQNAHTQYTEAQPYQNQSSQYDENQYDEDQYDENQYDENQYNENQYSENQHGSSNTYAPQGQVSTNPSGFIDAYEPVKDQTFGLGGRFQQPNQVFGQQPVPTGAFNVNNGNYVSFQNAPAVSNGRIAPPAVSNGRIAEIPVRGVAFNRNGNASNFQPAPSGTNPNGGYDTNIQRQLNIAEMNSHRNSLGRHGPSASQGRLNDTFLTANDPPFQWDTSNPDLNAVFGSLAPGGTPALATARPATTRLASPFTTPQVSPTSRGRRASRTSPRRGSRTPAVRRSSSSKSRSPPPLAVNIPNERPQLKSAKPFVRINEITKGLNKRPGKNNRYDPSRYYNHGATENVWTKFYAAGPKPFVFSPEGHLEESTLSLERFKAFIHNHPTAEAEDDCVVKHEDVGKLQIWIQRQPTDSAARYSNANMSACRLRDCVMPKRTIRAGHVRVAFDHKWNYFGEKADPFHIAFATHLYCLERYMSLPEICIQDNVVVAIDDRNQSQEMDGRNKAMLGGDEIRIGKAFLRQCRSDDSTPPKLDKARFTKYYPEYPLDGRSKRNYSAKYLYTLSGMIQKQANNARNGQAKVDFAQHLGDLEIIAGKGQKPSSAAKAKNQQKIADAMARVAEANQAFKAQQGKKRRRSSTAEEEVQESRPNKKGKQTSEDVEMEDADDASLFGGRSDDDDAEDLFVSQKSRKKATRPVKSTQYETTNYEGPTTRSKSISSGSSYNPDSPKTTRGKKKRRS